MRCRLISELGRSPRGGHNNSLPYSLLEKPMDWGAWKATVQRVAKCRTWLSNWARRQTYNVCHKHIFLKHLDKQWLNLKYLVKFIFFNLFSFILIYNNKPYQFTLDEWSLVNTSFCNNILTVHSERKPPSFVETFVGVISHFRTSHHIRQNYFLQNISGIIQSNMNYAASFYL